MTELRPQSLSALVRRMLREAREQAAIFDLPLAKCFSGCEQDLSVAFHGERAGTPLGPAAGPHSQMAQNLVLAWLSGSRVLELKTVQILDQLEIPRPCIDMATVGFNVEWSQELRLTESLTEYVKGSMLIEILRASGLVSEALALGRPGGDVIFDMSVGYDLAGIQSESVQQFICGMQDASEEVRRLRAELLAGGMQDVLAQDPWIAEIDFTTRLSNTLTLSTFHGCPSTEIEGIARHLLERNGLDVVVKLNPTLLGAKRVNELLRETLGYEDLTVPDSAFADDMKWDEMLGIIDRLGSFAAKLGRGFGVKFTNTQIVENNREFFPESEKQMYLSGAPLHVLAMSLVHKFRQHFGTRFPISFSAGIDRGNFAECVALGLVPVTVCTDLLRPGGYSRSTKYFEPLVKRMQESSSGTIADYVIRAFGHGRKALQRALDTAGDPSGKRRLACESALASGASLLDAAGENLHTAWTAEAALLNTLTYVEGLPIDPRYSAAKNSRPPKKIGAQLVLFDCTTCDKCVPVCPNNANFVFELPRLEVPIVQLRRVDNAWQREESGALVIEKAKQYANYADLCNECGNCDIFCPEDGGPYVVKPRFFGSVDDWRAYADQNGFVITRDQEGSTTWGRIDGKEFSLRVSAQGTRFCGPGFEVLLNPEQLDDPTAVHYEAQAVIDLTYYYILTWMRDGVFNGPSVNYLNTSEKASALS